MALAVPLTMASAETVVLPPQPVHPMDALTPDEIIRAVAILRQEKRADARTIYPSLALKEPDKAVVRAWKPGEPFRREAAVELWRENRLYRAVVDITAGKVSGWTELAGKFPRLMFSVFKMNDIIDKDPRYLAALAKRGFTTKQVSCAPLTPGPVESGKYAGHMVAFAPCSEVTDKKYLSFGRPIEGLMPVYDLTAQKILDVVDLGVVPQTMDLVSLRYAEARKYRPQDKPVEIVAPEGSNVSFAGSMVKWDNWKFHLRLDQRDGPVISLVTFDDHGADRSILYQLAASEMYVPYMDPAKTWSWRAYMDIGEYYFGAFSSVLRPGSDCPASASFLDLAMADETGKPVIKKSVLCVFERSTGDPVWRHGSENASRPNVELVVRMAPVVGNYDYFVDYVFDKAGNIDVRVGAMGIDAVKGVAARTLDDPTAAQDTAYGTLIAKGLVGTNHDHYISFRMDTDIDGVANRLVYDEVHPRMLPADSFRRSIWTRESKVIDRAGPITYPDSAGFLRVESVGRKNAMGYPTSYQLYPGHTVTSLLSPDDPIQVRASWSRFSTWASLHDPAQLHASGEHPYQDDSGDGLESWTKPAQAIDGKDVVLWYNVGFRHAPRAEDWPAMPAVWHTVRLRPFNFFDGSPAMDVPPSRLQVDDGPADKKE